ncbi:hypothetical protein DdX_14629 [Ditylenchus destructor]|uniref:Uncharacterized protein n=1 Tax=Ditylenchus destructor TaxID=166010 RepID=A0AAD4MU66_9BILA|nr:hypothetical protein DdX_14629 [Ditylenchus destructor]
MAPNPRDKLQPGQQQSAAQSRGRPLRGAQGSAENATGNVQGIAAQNHEERTQQKDHQSEKFQDGYFPPTDDVDWASSARKVVPSNLKESVAVNTQQKGQESDEPEVQIIEQDVQSGPRFNAQGDSKGSAAENVQGNLQGAAAIAPQKVAREAHIIVREQGTGGEVPTIGQGDIDIRGLHGAAAEAKKGHLMGAAAEAKKGHLMGAAAENVKGNLQGAAAISHEQKLQREANGQAQWQLTFNANDKKNGRGFDSQGGLVGAQNAQGILQGDAAISREQNSLVGAAAESENENMPRAAAIAHDQKVQSKGENGEFMTVKDQAQLPSGNERHPQNHGCGLDSSGATAPDAEGNLQTTPAMTHELKRIPEEDSDEPIPPKQAKYDKFNSPSDVSAH